MVKNLFLFLISIKIKPRKNTFIKVYLRGGKYMKFKNKWENGLKSSKKAIEFSKTVKYMKTEKPKKNHEKTENA